MSTTICRAAGPRVSEGFQGGAPRFEVAVCGSLNLDLVSRLAHLPQPGETVAARELLQLPGGKGLNQAVAAARMGARTILIGACGDDEAGAMLLEVLRAECVEVAGVRCRPAEAQPACTGTAQVWLAASGANSIVIHPGANATLQPNETRQSPPAAVYLAQLETPIAAVAEFFAHGKANGALCVLNAAPAVREARVLIALVDILIVNETELAVLAGETVEELSASERRASAAARRLLTDPRQSVVVTQGASGVRLVQSASTHHWPAHEVDVLDTTGAGDCFCGVLAASLAAGLELSQAIRRANVAAALSVTRLGAAPAMPTLRELDVFFGA